MKLSHQHPGYTVKPLTLQDSAVLQGLYEQCEAFFILTDGVAPIPTAAQEEFDDVPPGKTPEDVSVFGLFDAQDNLVGVISGVQQYPDPQTWWLGLMLIAPARRGQGLGADFYRAFEQWIGAQGFSQISLVVIEANEPGLRFWQRMGFTVIRKAPPQSYKAKTHAVYVLSRAVERGGILPTSTPLPPLILEKKP